MMLKWTLIILGGLIVIGTMNPTEEWKLRDYTITDWKGHKSFTSASACQAHAEKVGMKDYWYCIQVK